jgi:hypothetical protein
MSEIENAISLELAKEILLRKNRDKNGLEAAALDFAKLISMPQLEKFRASGLFTSAQLVFLAIMLEKAVLHMELSMRPGVSKGTS